MVELKSLPIAIAIAIAAATVDTKVNSAAWNFWLGSFFYCDLTQLSPNFRWHFEANSTYSAYFD